MTKDNSSIIVDARTGEMEAPSYDIAPVSNTSTALAQTSSATAVNFMPDMLPSRIKIAYAVSKNMPDDAPEGSLVIQTSDGSWVKLLGVNPPKPLTVLILLVKSYWKEWLTSEAAMAGARPKTYATKADAIADGQTTEWTPGGGRPTVSEAFDINLLVKMPEGMVDGADAFTLILGGEAWAPCLLTVDKTGAKSVRTFLSNLLMRDASVRRVPLKQAVTQNVFCTLHVKTQQQANGRKSRLPTFSALLDDKRVPVAPSDDFKAELSNIISCFSNANELSADPEDMPF